MRKQPSMEPRELIMRRKEIWPSVTPTYSTVQYTVQYSTLQYSTVQHRRQGERVKKSLKKNE